MVRGCPHCGAGFVRRASACSRCWAAEPGLPGAPISRPVLPVTRAAMHAPGAPATAVAQLDVASPHAESSANDDVARRAGALTNARASVLTPPGAIGAITTYIGGARRWSQPAVAAAVLILITVGVSGNSDSSNPPAGAVVLASSPARVPAIALPTVPAPTTATTATTAPRFAGNGRPLLGEPTGLALYAAVTKPGSNAATLTRIDLDTGRITELDGVLHGYPQQLMMAGDRLVVADDTVHAIDSSGRDQLLLPDAGSVVIKEGNIIGAVTMRGQRAVLSQVDVTSSTPVAEIELPAGVTKAFPDGLGQVVFEGPAGGVFRLDPATGRQRDAGWGHLRWAGHGYFEDVSCDERAQCQMMLHDLADGTTHRLATGPTAASAIAFPDPLFRYWVLGSVLPGDAEAKTRIIRLADSTTLTAPVALGPARYCSLGDCIPAQPVWTADGQWMLSAGDGTVSAWRTGLDSPITLPIDGRVIAITVAQTINGPGQPTSTTR